MRHLSAISCGAAIILLPEKAYASCGVAVSGTAALISTIVFALALIVFIKGFFWGFKAYKNKEMSPEERRKGLFVHVGLFLFFISCPFLFKVAHLAEMIDGPASEAPCCSVETIQRDTYRDVREDIYKINRLASHSAALCGCYVCYDSAMFKPSLKIENLFDDEILVEGKEYLLGQLYPVGTDVNDFRLGLSKLGLKEVQSFCQKPQDNGGFVAFRIYLLRYDSAWGVQNLQNIILAHHDGHRRILGIAIEVVPSRIYYDVPDESVLELAENNMISAQEELARRYGQYARKEKSDAPKSYFWHLVHEQHRAATMQDMPAEAKEKPSLVSDWWKKVTSFSFKKKRPTYIEWVSANLSSVEMQEIESEAQKWWSEHNHIEFCTPTNFQVVPEVREYISLSKAAEKGDSQSQYLLGLLYQEGRSGVVRQSAEKAHKWLSVAAAQGHESAILRLNPQKGETP